MSETWPEGDSVQAQGLVLPIQVVMVLETAACPSRIVITRKGVAISFGSSVAFQVFTHLLSRRSFVSVYCWIYTL